MSFVAGNYEIQEGIEPKKGGVEVFLVELPKIIKGQDGKSDRVEFTFKNADNQKQTQSFQIFDFVNQDPPKDDKAKKYQSSLAQRGVSLFTAFMTPEKKAEFDKVAHETFEGFCNTAFKYIDTQAALAMKVKILFGYGRNNFKELQMFGPCISSQYNNSSLVWNNALSEVSVKKPSKDKEEEQPDQDLV